MNRRRSLGLTMATAFVGLQVLGGPVTVAHATWPVASGADLTSPSNWPNDPDYVNRWDYFSFLPAQSPGTASYLSADQLLGASGMSIDKAWEHSIGSPSVKIAVIDSGIEWEDPDLIEQAWLNAAELSGTHMPQNKKGLPCGGTGALAGYDCNGDGVFTVGDYAKDPRITPIVKGDKCIDPATGAPKGDRIAGDVNHNCVLDAGDLIELFSDGVDDDANGYTDDIAGWDFFKNDNDPYDDTRSGHGTMTAEEANAQGNNGINTIGACPGCRFIMLRIGDSANGDSNDFAKALVYAADNVVSYGASNVSAGEATVAVEASSTVNLSAYARAAIDYAYTKNVVVVAGMSNGNSRHHSEPATIGHTLTVHSVDFNGSTVATSSSFLGYVNCTNYGGQLALSASGAGCSDEGAARTAGIAGLLESYAGALSVSPALTAEEVFQLVKMTSDVVNVPESRQPGGASTYYESLPGFSQRFGYGRANASSAMHALETGEIPPEVDILSPAWFQTLYDGRVASPVSLVGRVVASRAPSYDMSVEWAPGVEPLEADFTPLATTLSNIPGQTVTGGVTAPLALLDPSVLVTAHTADPDSPQHENDRTITVRVRATAHYASGDVRGEARRSIAIVNQQNGLDEDLLPGFPLALAGSAEGGPKLADINGDGVRDIVIATNDGLLHVFSVRGSAPEEVKGFPYSLAIVDGLDPASPVPALPSYVTAPAYTAGANGGIPDTVTRESVDGAPAIGDVTGDGSPDIVFTSWAGTIYVVDAEGEDEPGWPQRLPLVPSCSDDPNVPNPAGDCSDEGHALARGAFASPVLADFDGDGALEIVVAAFDGNVYVFHGDGTPLAGFPVRIHSPSAYRYDRILSTPAVADFNGDGVPDILIGTNETVGDQGNTGFYYVVDGNGTNAIGGPYLPDWPVLVPSVFSSELFGEGASASPVALDLDGDGNPDAFMQGNQGAPLIVPADPGVQSGTTPPSSQLPLAANGNASGLATQGPFGARSVATADTFIPLLSHPSVGDLDQDGTPDFIVAGAGMSLETNLGAKTAVPFQHLLAMWSGATGQMMPGAPVVLEDYSFMTGQAIADITGDGYPEVIAGTGGYFVHGVDACGREAAGWPKFTGGWVMGTPAVGNVTGGHSLDVVAATREGYLYAWATKGTDSGVVQWESAHHDNANSGNYGTVLKQGALLVASHPLVCDGSSSAAPSTTTSDAPSTSSSASGCGCSILGVPDDRPSRTTALTAFAVLFLVSARRRRSARLDGAAL